MATTASTIQFYLTFDIVNETITLTDNTTTRTAMDKGLVKITYLTTGFPLYTHPSWALAPASWVSPDIDGAISDWASAAIALTATYNGRYKIEYKFYDDATQTTYTVERLFTLDYTAVEGVIELTVLCSTSQLISEDATDYTITMGGVDIDPTTTTRSHTIVKPAGSGYSGTLGTTTDAIRTIGGGSTDGTRLWTRTWQTVLSTVVTYPLAAWSATTAEVYLTDTVEANDETYAQCDGTICALAACYKNLLDRWIASISTNFAYKEDTRDKVIQAAALWAQLQWLERCGSDVEDTILALQTLLAGENCNCTTVADTKSVPITPWAAIVSGGSPTSTFAYHLETTDPTAQDGNNGDVWQNTTSGDVFQKVAGAWTLKGNVKGSAGTDATATERVKVLISDSTARPTPASTDTTALSYTMAVNNSYFDWEGDHLLFTYEVKLAHNDNGKMLRLSYDSSTLLEWLTDDLVTADNDIVVVNFKLTRVNNISQHLTAWLERAGGVVMGPVIYRDYAKDLNTSKDVVLNGINSETSAADLTGYSTVIKLYKREVELIPGGSGASDGRGLVSQTFTATEGQDEFTVTDFTANSYYIPLIDNVIQSQLVVTRNGNVFTYLPGLSEGQILTIVN
jgi:hypothetical protein